MNYKQTLLTSPQIDAVRDKTLSFGCVVETNEPENQKEMAAPDRFTATCLGFTHSEQEVILATYDYLEPFTVWNDEIEFARLNFKIIGHTPHLEHWLRGIGAYRYFFDNYGRLYKEVGFDLEHVDTVTLELVFDRYNLTKDGENQSEEFYKVYCEIVGV